MRRITSVALGALAVLGMLATTAVSAQATTISCPLPSSGPIFCTVVSNKKPIYTTAISFNVAPDTALVNSTLTASGRVYTLNGKERTTNNGGTVYLYFRRAGETAFSYQGLARTNASGYYSFSTKALHTGTWKAKYAGHASSTVVTGRSASWSGLDAVTVVRKAILTIPFPGPSGLTSHWVSSAHVTRVTGSTSPGGYVWGQVVLGYSLLCSNPGATVKFTLTGLNNGLSSTVSRTFSNPVFSGSSGLTSYDTVDQFHVDVISGGPCTVNSVQATQTATAVVG